MKTRMLVVLAVFFAVASGALAQVPGIINYQGRVTVGGTNLDGTGYFKFALVNGAGNVTYWSHDGSSITGSPPASSVAMPVSKGLYSVLLGDTTVTNMTAAISAATFTNSDVRLRVWFSPNGSGFLQFSPDQRLATVGYAMLAANVPDGVITSAKIANGAIGATQLAAGAAAANLNASGQSGVASGGIVLSAADDPALVAAGYVKLGVAQLADGWQLRSANAPPVARYQHTAVWDGSEMLVWGGMNSSGAYLNDGARYNPAANSWNTMSLGPSARAGHTAVWSGTQMIVWGGWDGSNYRQDGGIYNPASDFFATFTGVNVPAARQNHTAVWGAPLMIIWGGIGAGSVCLNDGASYDPVGNSWTALTSANAPAARQYHTAVWNGTNTMIIWGGVGANNTNFNDGGRFCTTNTSSWLAVNTNGAPIGRSAHGAVWDGTNMIVWGGYNSASNTYFNNGGRYNPLLNTWSSMNTNGAPSPRTIGHGCAILNGNMYCWGGNSSGNLCYSDGGYYSPSGDSWTAMPTNLAPVARSGHTMVSDGTGVIVWGGVGANNTIVNDGGRYNPTTCAWTPLSATVPAARANHTAVWSGTEMIVWGGVNGATYYNDGGRYNAAANAWIALPSVSLAGRANHTAVWDGSGMIVWGGIGGAGATYYNDGARYSVVSNGWSAVGAAPLAARANHTAVWDGTEMIVWGGVGGTGGTYYNTGGRYNPVSNSWNANTLVNAPLGREYHAAVWDGTEMIVWGGRYNSGGYVYCNDGGRYNPVNDTWSAMATLNEPANRAYHTAVWNGTDMIIWGGWDSGGGWHNDGARYNPVANLWVALPTLNAPAGREYHTAVWDGTGMIVWGGSSGSALNTGGRFNPTANTWSTVTTTGAPAARQWHTAVWDGAEMIVWGGYGTGYFNDTYTYTPGKTVLLYQRP